MSLARDSFFARIDLALLAPALALCALGLLTMHTFGAGASLAPRQLVWVALGVVVYFALVSLDLRFLRRTPVVLSLYVIAFALLALVLVVSRQVMGAHSWFTFAGLSFQPADFAKLAIIALLAKYLSRRHVAIGDFRHILVSGAYTAAFTLLILVEPDLGNAIIFTALWLGMMLVSGISKRHLAIIGAIGLVLASALWFGGLHQYQRQRILSFVNPAADIHGTGYNAYQAKVAVGSGGLFGKGIGYGTQSKLRFLPEYQTDFIFAAYAEEWGFVGILLALALYGLLFWRLLAIARTSATNFDAFFTLGTLILLAAHMIIHSGISLGLLPVTGTTIPFMSYGGSHILLEFVLLGIVSSLASYGRMAPRGSAGQEYYA
ncbi:MAG: FtsW/RodA/SpoVE family cell cycle protein [Minisyncoccia bacterium]